MTWKIIYTSLLPSNDFPESDTRRERERARRESRESELDRSHTSHRTTAPTLDCTLTPPRLLCRDRSAKIASSRSRHWDHTPDRIAKIAPPPLPSRLNSHRLNLGAPWSLPLLDRSHCPWPTHDRSLSFLIYLSLYLNLRSLSRPPFLCLTEFLSLTNGFDLIFVSLSLFIEIFYYKICLEVEKMTEKMWETSRKIAFSECNQTPENIFQNNFHNVTKYLKIFSFPKNIFTCKYFTLRKYFTCCQMQP